MAAAKSGVRKTCPSSASSPTYEIQIVAHNGTVYLAGQVGDDMNAGIEQQTRETLANIEHLLDLAGTDKPGCCR